MANPVLINCSEGAWTKVAENVISGVISLTPSGGAFSYLWTSRDTGQSAPSNSDGTDSGLALPMFEHGRRREPIVSTNAQDFYLWVKNADGDDTDNIDVRVDL